MRTHLLSVFQRVSFIGQENDPTVICGVEMIKDPGLFAMLGAALGLATPWQVTSVEFDSKVGKLETSLDFPRGSRLACPHEGCHNASCPVHDTMEKTWRQLDFFYYRAFLSA